MSNIDKRALRESAEKATKGQWAVEFDDEVYATDGVNNEQIAMVFSENEARDAAFIAEANPATVLALLDELEAKDNRINRLEAIVAVAEQRNALMREWKRALKVPCDLVDDQVPVVIHGMVIRLERLKETDEKLEAAENRIAELSELLKKSDVEKKQPQNTLSGRPVYLGDGSDTKEKVIAGKRDIHRYGSLITDKAGKGD